MNNVEYTNYNHGDIITVGNLNNCDITHEVLFIYKNNFPGIQSGKHWYHWDYFFEVNEIFNIKTN